MLLRFTALAVALLLAACATPQPAPSGLADLMERPAERALFEGIRAYDDGNYAVAETALRKALAGGLQTGRDQATAHKLLAFITCTSDRVPACEDAFRAARARRPGVHAQPLRSRPPVVGPGLQAHTAVAARGAGAPGGVPHNPRADDRLPAASRALPPPAACLLGRHRCRRRGVLRQLPEVLRTRAHRMAAQPGRRPAGAARATRAPSSSSPRRRCATCARRAWTTRSRSRSPCAKPAGPRCVIAQQAWCGDALLAEGTIRIGCVDHGTFRPRAHSHRDLKTACDEPGPLHPHPRHRRPAWWCSSSWPAWCSSRWPAGR